MLTTPSKKVIKNEKKIYKSMVVAASTEHKLKTKESEK